MTRLGDSRISMVSSPRAGALAIFGISSLVMGLSLLMTRSRSGLAALGAASILAALIVFRRQPTRTAKLAVVASFVVLLGGAAAWAGVDALTGKFRASEPRNLSSVGGRLAIWNDTLHVFRAFPVTGSGFNTYGTAMSVYQTFDRTSHYQEAHNEYLQILAEGGMLVGLPVLLTLAVFVTSVRRRFREAPKDGTTYWLRVGAVIGIVAVALQSLVEFSLQMPGNAALFALVAAIALHQSPRLRVSDLGATAIGRV
jgi:O-antigen ligase